MPTCTSLLWLLAAFLTSTWCAKPVLPQHTQRKLRQSISFQGFDFTDDILLHFDKGKDTPHVSTQAFSLKNHDSSTTVAFEWGGIALSIFAPYRAHSRLDCASRVQFRTQNGTKPIFFSIHRLRLSRLWCPAWKLKLASVCFHTVSPHVMCGNKK